MKARPSVAETFLSVVMPVYNEAAVLHTLTDRVRDALAATGSRGEIVYVDDGSRDGSPRILDELAATYEDVRVVHFSRNFGHQAAVQAGLAHARGDAVILMDSDLQDEPRAIAAFVDRWRAGYDVVYALRVERKERWWKRMLFNGFHRLLSGVATTPVPSDAGNFGLMDARVVRQLLTLDERDRYLPGLRSWVGFAQIGIEVPRNARYDAQPRVSLRGLFRLAKTAIFSFSSLPLTLFYGIGALALTVFCLLSCYALCCRMFTDAAIPGWTSHVLTGSFFGAINALGIAMLGEYVVRIYDQVRNRPLYLVDRLVGFEGTALDGRGNAREARATHTETRETRRGLAKIIRREEVATAMPQIDAFESLLNESRTLVDQVERSTRTVEQELEQLIDDLDDEEPQVYAFPTFEQK